MGCEIAICSQNVYNEVIIPSGSGKMWALTEESEDEDDFIGLGGLPPGLFKNSKKSTGYVESNSRKSGTSGNPRGRGRRNWRTTSVAKKFKIHSDTAMRQI
jgi:hypothetical protein